MTVFFQPGPTPEPWEPKWPYVSTGERPEVVAAVVEALKAEFSYIDISQYAQDDDEWEAIARVAIKAVTG